MVSSVLIILTVVLFIPIKTEILHKQKRRRQIAEFDLTPEENTYLAKKLGEKFETQLGRSYEFLGHKLSDLGTQLEENKNNLAEKATDIYKGPLADKTSNAYENFQSNYGKIGDGLSSILTWLGQNVIKLGHNSGSIIRTSFHSIGDFFGDTVDKTEHFIGNGLIKSGEKVHAAAIDLQHTSHNNSENLRHKLQLTAPEFSQTLNRVFGKLGHKIHTIGIDTETAGEVIEQHHFLDTIKRAYNN